VGETVPGGSYAVLFNTGTLYGGEVRPTIAYVATGDIDTYSVPPPSAVDVEEIEAQRDAAWENALRHGDPWPSA
jgi:hypothetical protein